MFSQLDTLYYASDYFGLTKIAYDAKSVGFINVAYQVNFGTQNSACAIKHVQVVLLDGSLMQLLSYSTN